ncbi:serine/threonine-protein kinase [Kitasatospora sp. NPDC057015]|uniref:serine/threonine-protein kinase n=1 Tax=Kitasatospora sp. NPDC057015 TaxID=3346001 RepID=UPI00363F4009
MVRKIGRGGFGVVWEAFDAKVGRPVAVKVISEENATDEREVRRFVAEARTVGNLSHPHIVTLYDLGEVRGAGFATHYLVMELVRGSSLAEVLRGGLPGRELALRWAGQVCGALDAAHRAGVVHRDIKPENIMITEAGEAKVLDFGIARLETQAAGLTSTGSVIGSPHYLAPERWSGGPVDGRADLYALGCVLYQLCSGEKPFTADNAVTLMYQHLNDTPDAPPGVEPELAALVLQLLAKAPADRPADAAEVRRRLAAIEAGPPVPAAPAGPSPEQLKERADQAWARGADGEPAEAVRLLRALLPEFAGVCGPADPRTLRTCHDLALWLARSGELLLAVDLLRELAAPPAGPPGAGAAGEGARADAARDLVRWERELARRGPGGGRLAGGASLTLGTVLLGGPPAGGPQRR